jgi:hypothetical protein
MIVEKENCKITHSSCNFCKRGTISPYQSSLMYPYSHVFAFSPEGSGLKACICEDCIKELVSKAKVHIVNT